MRMNDATNLWMGAVHLAVNRKFMVASSLACERIAVEVDQDQIVFGHLFETDTRTLDPILPWRVRKRGHVSVDHIVVPLHGENTASQGQFFLQAHQEVLHKNESKIALRMSARVSEEPNVCQIATKKAPKEIATKRTAGHADLPSFRASVGQALAARPSRAVIVIVTAEGAMRTVEDFTFYCGMPFQKLFEIVVLVQIFLAVDQIGVVTQLGRHLGMVLQEIMELLHLIAQIAPGCSRGTEDRQR